MQYSPSLTNRIKAKQVARAIRDGVRQEPYQLKYIENKTTITILPSHVFMAGLKTEGAIKIANSKLTEFQIDSYEFSLTADNLVKSNRQRPKV